MSLQVWLPLNGDLHNQGLSNIIMTNNGATVNNDGKIGKCYYFNASSYLTESNYNWTNFNTTEFSLCCWYKQPSPVASGNSQIICIGTNSGWNNIRIGLLRRTSSGYPMFSVSNGTSAVQYNCTATTFSFDTWNHIACTYKNGEIKIYLNGKLDKTYTTTIEPVLNSSQHLGIGAASNGAEKLTGYLNDVRIYDHCLSTKEVEEIAKGLILHYKLDRQNDYMPQIPSENLFIGTGFSDYDIANFVGNGSTDWTKTFRYYNGSASIHSFEDGVDNITLTSTSNLGIAFVRKATDINLDSTSYYTISCEAKCTSISKNFCIGLSYYTTNNSWVWRGGNNPKAFTAANTWQKFTLKFKPDANTQYICYCFTVATGGNNTLSIRNCKLEKGETATDWCLNHEETGYVDTVLTGNDNWNTIYDSSGYNNNGTIIGSLVTTTPSPRYSCTTKFNGSSRITHNTLPSIYTLSCWCKTDKNKSTSQFVVADSGSNMCISFYQGTIIGVFGTTRSTGSKCTLGSEYKENDWNHIVVVKTSEDGQRDIYCNGVKLTPAANDYWSAATGFWVGTRNSSQAVPFYGNITDVRAYATVLTEAQIKELYNTSLTIDKNGNIYAREQIENLSDINITKTGQLQSNKIVDDNTITIANFKKSDKSINGNTIYEY